MNQVYFDTYKMTGKWETETIDGQSVDIFTEPVEQDFMLRAINDGNRQLILRAKDGDITTDGISTNENTGGGDDWTIGNATSKSLSVTFLNEPKESESGIYDGELLSRVTFDRLAAYYGYKASSSTWSSPGTGRTSYWVAPDTNAVFYGTANGAFMNGTRIPATNAKSIVGFFLVCRGDPNSDTRNYPIIFGTDTLFLWDTSQQVYVAVDYEDYYDAEDYIFMLAKLTDNGYSGCVDGNIMKTWRVETQGSVTVYTEEAWQYVPVGVFDFSNVSIYGTVYTAEVYDLMSLMEVDATDWIATNWGSMTHTADGIATAIATYFNSLYPDLSNYVSISSSAVNLGVQLLRNPFTEKRYIFREVLGLIAESIGCNVRISPTRVITFYTYGTTPAQAYYDVNGTLTLQDIVVTPHSIVNGSRDKGRYAVPQVDKLVYLATNGGVYTNGAGNNTYTMTGNPIVENGAQAASVFARNLYALLHAVPSYYASKLTVAHANPCIEAGDLITIRNRDDNTTYNILLTDISSHWAGLNVADYSADGKQERTALDSTEISLGH